MITQDKLTQWVLQYKEEIRYVIILIIAAIVLVMISKRREK